MLPFETKIFAHRGLHGDPSVAPENSLEAFHRAVEAGYGMELDIQLSKDGQIVVFHDDTLDRVCGVPGYVNEFTYDELKELRLHDSDQRIPLLSEVLDLVDGRTPLIIELKAARNQYVQKLCEDAAVMLDHYQGPYCIESFHPLYVYWFRRNRPQVRRGQLCTDFYRTHSAKHMSHSFLMQTMAFNYVTKPDFIAYDHHYMNNLIFRLWRRKITPVAWTVRSSEELKKCKKVFDYYIMEKVWSS